MKRLFSMILTIGVIFSLSSMIYANDHQYKIVGDEHYPPYEFVNEQGEYVGFNIDLMRAIFLYVGANVEFEPYTWDEALLMVEKGEADFLMGLTKNEKRSEQYTFLEPFIDNNQVLFVSKNNSRLNDIQDIYSLKNEKIACQNEDIAHEVLKEYDYSLEIVVYNNQYDAMKALVDGEVEVFAGNLQTGIYNLKKLGKFNEVRILNKSIYSADYGPATAKLSETELSFFNQAIKEIKKNGTLDRIYYKWFGYYPPSPKIEFSDYIIYIVIGVILFLTMIGAFFLFNHQLKIKVDEQTATIKENNMKLLSYQTKLNQIAFHDFLTGLPNRVSLYMKLENTLKKTPRSAFILFDLDRFKQVNDSFGHDVGDQLLIQVADRLKNKMNHQDFAARIGGDEFLVAIFKLEDNLEDWVKILIEMFEEPFYIKGFELHITISIGTALYPQDGKNIEELIKYADSAMYETKKNGRNGYTFYRSELTDRIVNTQRISEMLYYGMKHNEIFFVYQPKLDMKTKEIVGYEALARWIHDDQFIPPDKFISIAEETGQILPLGNYLFDKLLNQIRIWKERFDFNKRIFFNLSIIQFYDEMFINKLEEGVKDGYIDPSNIGIEITESAVAKDIDYTLKSLEKLKELGFIVSIDDFGTGYSSFAYLRDMAFDEIKIDRRFVAGIHDSEKNLAIFKSMVELGLLLDKEVIAEGVEEEDQVNTLLDIGCRIGQGYYFSKGLLADEIEDKFLIVDKK